MYNKQNLSRCNGGYSPERSRGGQSIIEVVIALALISIVLITLVAMAALSIKASVFARNQTEATRYTEQAAEWLREEKNEDWGKFKAHALSLNWCLDDGPNLGLNWNTFRRCPNGDTLSNTIFQRNLSFINNSDGSIQATVETSWNDAQGKHVSSTSTLFTNW